jgi:hypothetical protein
MEISYISVVVPDIMAQLISHSVVAGVLNGRESDVAAGIAFIQVVNCKIAVLVETGKAHGAHVV